LFCRIVSFVVSLFLLYVVLSDVCLSDKSVSSRRRLSVVVGLPHRHFAALPFRPHCRFARDKPVRHIAGRTARFTVVRQFPVARHFLAINRRLPGHNGFVALSVPRIVLLYVCFATLPFCQYVCLPHCRLCQALCLPECCFIDVCLGFASPFYQTVSVVARQFGRIVVLSARHSVASLGRTSSVARHISPHVGFHRIAGSWSYARSHVTGRIAGFHRTPVSHRITGSLHVVSSHARCLVATSVS
jgi:hypothetical protein